MITRITKSTTAESLVGRYVVRDAGTLFGAVAEPRKVVSARGKIVELEEVPRFWSETEKRWVVGEAPGEEKLRQGGEPSQPKQVRTLLFACDTLEELDRLMAFSHEAAKAFNELLTRTRAELMAMANNLKEERKEKSSMDPQREDSQAN